MGVAVGGGVLVLVALALCAFCCVHFMRTHRGGRTRHAPGSPMDKVIMFRSPITLANIQEATGQFDEDHVLSRTRHGIVFKAILQVHTYFVHINPVHRSSSLDMDLNLFMFVGFFASVALSRRQIL